MKLPFKRVELSAENVVAGQLAPNKIVVSRNSGAGPVTVTKGRGALTNCLFQLPAIVPDGSQLSGWALQPWLLGADWLVLKVPFHPKSLSWYFDSQ